jgi:uncharacterized protein YjbJ (UPF0337 family)
MSGETPGFSEVSARSSQYSWEAFWAGRLENIGIPSWWPEQLIQHSVRAQSLRPPRTTRRLRRTVGACCLQSHLKVFRPTIEQTAVAHRQSNGLRKHRRRPVLSKKREKAKEVEGRVKEVAGFVTGDRRVEAAGRAEQKAADPDSPVNEVDDATVNEEERAVRVDHGDLPADGPQGTQPQR